MQALHDIFAIWPSISLMATAVDEKQDTVYRWKRRARIPEGAWKKVIEEAALLGKVLTIADMHAANRPPKPRGGRRAHKMSGRRREERVGS